MHASIKVYSLKPKSIAKDMGTRNDQWCTCANYFRSKFTIVFCLKPLVMQTIPQCQCLPKRSLQWHSDVSITQQKQINHRVVTLVADKLKTVVMYCVFC